MSSEASTRTETRRAVVWVIDDIAENHDYVRRSLPDGHEDACDLTGYLSANEALSALATLLGDASEGHPSLPDVIFMDYFLDDATGEDVTREMRLVFSRHGLPGPFIIGHSSARNGSLRIVRAGGDVAIEKDRGHAVSPGVRRLFPDVEALRGYAGRATRPQGT